MNIIRNSTIFISTIVPKILNILIVKILYFSPTWNHEPGTRNSYILVACLFHSETKIVSY